MFHVQMFQVWQVIALTVMLPISAQLCKGVLENRLEYLYLQQAVVYGK